MFLSLMFWLKFAYIALLLLSCMMNLFMRSGSPTCHEIRGLFAFTQCERSKVRILEGSAEYQGSKIMILKNMQWYYHYYIATKFQKKGFVICAKNLLHLSASLKITRATSQWQPKNLSVPD